MISASISQIDCDRFGLVVAKSVPEPTSITDIDDLLVQAKGLSVSLLIFRISASAMGVVQYALSHRATLTDTLVIFDAPLAKTELRAARGNVVMRDAKSGDTTSVERLAASAFRDYPGHYHLDPRLQKDSAAAVYTSWARRSIEVPGVADKVLVAIVDDAVVGFLSLKQHQSGNAVEMVLSAVDARFEGRGIYLGLLSQSIEWARAIGAGRVFTSTQVSNIAVQRSWCRLGLSPREYKYTFHLWL